jgi:hypothetical protein
MIAYPLNDSFLSVNSCKMTSVKLVCSLLPGS